MEITVKRIEGVLVAELPAEVAARLAVKEGDRIALVETSAGLALRSEALAQQLDLSEDIMARNAAVLSELAK